MSEIIHYHDLSTQTWKGVRIKFPSRGQIIEIEDLNEPTIKYALKSFMEFQTEAVSSSSPPIIYTDVENEAVSKSFFAGLTYSGKVQNTLITEYLCRCATIVKGGHIYAPYSVLCQSSGFGKSRGACETGRRLAAIYGVFRKSTDTGYPKQANWLNIFYDFINYKMENLEVDIPESGKFIVSNYKVGRVLIFFNCLMSAFVLWFKTLIGEALYKEIFEEKKVPTSEDVQKIKILSNAYDTITDSYKTGDSGVKTLHDYLQAEFLQLKDNINLTVDEICNQISAKASKFVPVNKLVFKHKNKLDEELWGDFIKTHLNGDSAHQIWPNENQESFPFIVILDEASVLSELARPGQVSTLTIIRRALHLIPPTNSFLVVTLGTNCDISTLNRPVTDNSLRSVERSNLLFPLIVTGNWDIHAEESNLHELVVDGNLLRNHRTLLLSCSFGRPLWSSLAVLYMIPAAIAKVRNGCSDLFTPMIAAWCIRVGLTVHADSKLSEKLLRSHMAILFAASSDSERIIVNYSAEPILAIAALGLIKEKKIEYFKSLLKFVEGVPTDRGKIGESIFSEILLSAFDKSTKIETGSNVNPDGACETVVNILSTQKFLLETTKEPLTEAQNESNLAIDNWCKDNYHVTNVDNFLKSLYSDSVLNKIRPFLPAALLSGLLNFRQFITTHRDFPYEKFFDKEMQFEELDDASGGCKKICDIFDKEILKAGLLKSVAYGCPAGYYGFDAVIPVLLEVDVEVEEIISEDGKTIENVIGLQRPIQLPQTRSGSAVDDETIEPIIKKKHVYSFIGVQYKVGKDDKIETLTKTDPFIHLNSRNYENWEMEAIRENFLVLVLSSENDCEKSNLSDARVNSVNEPYCVTVYDQNVNDFAVEGKLGENLKRTFYKLPETITNLNVGNIIKSPKFPSGVPKPSAYSQIKIAPHVNICGLNWSDQKKHVCLWTSSLLAFEGLLDDEVLDLSHQILRCDRSIFKSQFDEFAFKTLADAVLNTHFAYYPNSDPLIRKLRGQGKIKPVLTNFSHWNSDLTVDNTPKKMR